MKVTYDPEADVLYVRLRDTPVADTTTLEEQGVAGNLAIDLDDEDQVGGFEITGASRLSGSNPLVFTFEVLRREAETPAAAE